MIEGPARMVEVASSDGTTIAVSVGGQGPPIVLVHGTTGSDFSWARVRPHLEHRHSVVAVQRRGRGRSGDGLAYSFSREAEDVAAVVDALGAPVALVGHSFGADCSLEATLLTTNVSRLILYEPAFGWPVDESILGRVDAHVAAGELELATETYLRDAVQLSDREIELLRSSPTWNERVRAAHTLAREDRAGAAYRLIPGRFADMMVPTLLLLGSESPPGFRERIEAVDAAFSDSTIRILDGQGHAANITAPDLLATEILAFTEA